MHHDLRRLLRFATKSPRFWKRVGLAALVLAVIAGAAPSHGEPRALRFLFDGDQTKQLYFGLGLAFLVFGFVVPVARMTANILRPMLWVWLFVAGALWTHGKAVDVPHLILTNPAAGLIFFAGITLVPIVLGNLYIAQRAKRSTKFGSRNQPSQDR